MSKKSIETKVQNIVESIISTSDIELIDIEYVKEGPFKYLRVYIDKPDGITVDDCSDLSRILNKKLDEIDLIEEQYFLEVSSPGLERAFKTQLDFEKNINNTVEAKLYKPMDGKKVISGILVEKTDEYVIINSQNENITIELSDISKINRVIEDF
jgi:ribosome maturation factor RimP